MSSDAARRAAERIANSAVCNGWSGGELDKDKAAEIIDEEQGKPGKPMFYSVDTVSGEVRGLWNSETGQTDPLPKGHVPDLCYASGVPHYTIPCGDWGHGDRRERLACAALTGLLASGRHADYDSVHDGSWRKTVGGVAEEAAGYADALAAALDGQGGEGQEGEG